jgi:hypothetical protein
MRLERILTVVALTLLAFWAAGFTLAVLRDNQLPGDMAVGAVIAAVLLPAFFAACMLGLLVWPIVRAIQNDDDQDGPFANER